MGVVKIKSQDASTVTVDLYQAWTIGVQYLFDSVNQFYAIYMDSVFNRDCDAFSNVEEGYIGNITMYCNTQETPKALLKICVADNLSNNVLSDPDGATIDKCCYPPDPFPEHTGVVCYTLSINCVTECIPEAESRFLRG